MGGQLTNSPRAISRYFHPVFCVATSQGAGAGGHDREGMTTKPITAETTEPTEKNTDNAVTRYCFPFGICSSSSVPSVGIDPYESAHLVILAA